MLTFQNPKSKVAQLFLFIISLFNIIAWVKALKWIETERPDVIHVHNWHFASSASIFWAARIKDIPVIFTLHNYRILCPSATLFNDGKIFTDSLQEGFPFSAIRKKVYRNSYLQTFWLSFIVQFHYWIGTWQIPLQYITLTSSMKHLFMDATTNFPSEKFVVKPNFIADCHYNFYDREDTFLYIGRLSEEKGIRVLLKAFSDKKYKLKVIGDGPLMSEVEDFAALHSNVSVLGFQSRATIQEELLKCTALIFPSNWYEPFGLTLIEAFASGAPVIASNMGSSQEMVIDGKNGIHFRAGSAKDLQIKLHEWVKLSSGEKILFSKNARSSYENNYTPEKNLELLTSIYNKLTIERAS